MANLVQLRRGQTIPEDGALQPYELGYRLVVDKSATDLLHHNDREFYIGEKIQIKILQEKRQFNQNELICLTLILMYLAFIFTTKAFFQKNQIFCPQGH